MSSYQNIMTTYCNIIIIWRIPCIVTSKANAVMNGNEGKELLISCGYNNCEFKCKYRAQLQKPGLKFESDHVHLICYKSITFWPFLIKLLSIFLEW